MKIGITGASGFIGYHTYTRLKYTTEWDVIALDRDFFNDERTKECDWIIHLAGMNRGDHSEIYWTNLTLAQKLKSVIGPDCKVINVSSTLVDDLPDLLAKSLLPEQHYPVSKRQTEELFVDHTNIRLPNIYGEFAKPNYNSVVATFCHKLCLGETPEIIEDRELNIMYVGDVVDMFKQHIMGDVVEVDDSWYRSITVSGLLDILQYYKKTYLDDNTFPQLNSPLQLSLFNTFRSYMTSHRRMQGTKLHADERGDLTELIKTYPTHSKVFVSNTNPGFTRGEHFHMNKVERFCVIKGSATIRLRKIGTEDRIEYSVHGDNIKVIDIPTFYTHNITNTGTDTLTTIFWTTEDDTDNYWENV